MEPRLPHDQSSSSVGHRITEQRCLSFLRRPNPRVGAAVIGALLTLLLAGGAAAVVSVRSRAEAALSSVKTQPEAANVARVPLTKAEEALERSRNARSAGDERNAELLDELALEWANTAVDLARSAELEARADRIEQEAAQLEARAKRALTLIEQTVARRAQAVDRLRDLGVELDPKEPVLPSQPSAAEVAQ